MPGSPGPHGLARRGEFSPAWWLPSPHAQTLWQPWLRRFACTPYRRARIELADGDFLDLDHLGPRDGPAAVLVHGLDGSSRSPAVAGLARALARRGWRVAAMNLRGCGGTPNRLPRSYHAAAYPDLEAVVEHLAPAGGGFPLAVVGISLGANLLLGWLGRDGAAGRGVRAAVAICAPLVLAVGADRLERGFSRVYQRALVRGFHRRQRSKFRQRTSAVDLGPPWAGWRWTLRELDERFTAPLHGYDDHRHYYREASARPYLRGIEVPTLILHARDDPFMTEAVIPQAAELSPAVRMEICDAGGHVGFVGGRIPLVARYWLERRVPDFLDGFR